MTPVSSFRLPSDPHLRRWMMFVDGENLTIRTQRLAADSGVRLVVGGHFMTDTFVWLPGVRGTQAVTPGYLELQPHAIRASYYTNVGGDDDKIWAVREQIRELGFSPHVFKKGRREDKAKAVDVTLTHQGSLGERLFQQLRRRSPRCPARCGPASPRPPKTSRK
jgi:hypothetical protein